MEDHAGNDMYDRLKSVILDCKSRGYEFITYNEFAETNLNRK